jgi:hypothetical protein
VTFLPEGGGRIASGLTDEDGDFELSSFGMNDGALPGNYKVTVAIIQPFREADRPSSGDWEKDLKQATQAHVAKYYVTEGESQPKRDPKAMKAIYSDLSKTPLRCQVLPKASKIVLELETEGGGK